MLFFMIAAFGGGWLAVTLIREDRPRHA